MDAVDVSSVGARDRVPSSGGRRSKIAQEVNILCVEPVSVDREVNASVCPSPQSGHY